MKQLFKSIYLEITDECGLKCPFCPSKDLKKEGYINIELIKERLKKIKGFSKQIYLHILGEPLLHPNINEIFTYCDEENINLAVTTNALFIDKLQINKHQCIKKINISLQSIITSNITSNNIDIRLNKIYSFLKERNDSIGISLRLWNDKTNEETIKFNKTIQNKLNDLLKDINLKNITWSYEDEFKWPNLNNEINNQKTTCLGGKKQLGILLNGNVVLCCLDYLGNTTIGNIDNESLEDILNKDIYKDVLKGWNNRNPYFELCKKCTFRNKFIK